MFDYGQAFSRNIGWVTEPEQAILRSKRIAIAGLGGVGGGHLLTLTRLGIGAFNIADFDSFDIPNFNRQAGAMMSTLGQDKAQTLARMASDVNPELQIRLFPAGISEQNIDDFLDGVDLYVDSLDFFAFAARRLVFRKCAEKGIPAVTAAPLGMGTAVLSFLPGQMTFEEYFQLEGQSEFEQGIRFLLGLAPARLHMGYLADKTRVNLQQRRGPSTGMACQICAGVAATEALKILLRRGEVLAAPWGFQFDAYKNRFKRTWRPGGNKHPLQRLALAIARKQLGAELAATQTASPAQAVSTQATLALQVLDLARWAPSGDNTQVWRFEITGDDSFNIHSFDTRDHVVYDIDGHPSQLSLGALLETIRIAASVHRHRVDVQRSQPSNDDRRQCFTVKLLPDEQIHPDPLAPYITTRTVQRRKLSTRPLNTSEKAALEKALGAHFRIVWLEGAAKRRQMASLLFANAKIRLTMPEAFEVHRSVIEWDSQFSADKMPDRAIGMDPVGLKLMKWAMQSWSRVNFMNRYLAGTWLPRIQLDLVPALGCAAHFMLLAPTPPQSVDDYIEAGKIMQRFWLTATSLGLQLQPEMTPLIFAAYVRSGKRFSTTAGLWEQAEQLTQRFSTLIGSDTLGHAAFMGRIGHGPAATSRSTRLSLDQLAYRPE